MTVVVLGAVSINSVVTLYPRAPGRTYLFCAIRPEVTYHKYTFSTLGFAKNASVVKLKPKMATVRATPAERKLMEELEQMKVLDCGEASGIGECEEDTHSG